jgi:hypothetical protein
MYLIPAVMKVRGRIVRQNIRRVFCVACRLSCSFCRQLSSSSGNRVQQKRLSLHVYVAVLLPSSSSSIEAEDGSTAKEVVVRYTLQCFCCRRLVVVKAEDGSTAKVVVVQVYDAVLLAPSSSSSRGRRRQHSKRGCRSYRRRWRSCPYQSPTGT